MISPSDESHPIIAVKPALTSKDLRTMDITPCDRDCFKFYLGTGELVMFLIHFHRVRYKAHFPIP